MNDYLTDLRDHMVRHHDGRLAAALQPWVASPMAPAMRGVICWTSLGRTPQVLENQIVPQLQETKSCPLKLPIKHHDHCSVLGFFSLFSRGELLILGRVSMHHNHPQCVYRSIFQFPMLQLLQHSLPSFTWPSPGNLCSVTTRSFISP